jgi:hypothetical protein
MLEKAFLPIESFGTIVHVNQLFSSPELRRLQPPVGNRRLITQQLINLSHDLVVQRRQKVQSFHRLCNLLIFRLK